MQHTSVKAKKDPITELLEDWGKEETLKVIGQTIEYIACSQPVGELLVDKSRLAYDLKCIKTRIERSEIGH